MLLLMMIIIDDDNGDGDDGDNHDADHLPLVGLSRHHDRVPSRLRPHKSRRVELLDVRLKLCKTLAPSFHPLHMDGGLALEVLQHPIRIELSSVEHLENERSWCRAHSDPAKCRYRLTDRREMVEELSSPSLLTEFLDLPNQVGGGLQDCGEVAVRRLCCQRGDSQELPLSLEGFVHHWSKLGDLAPNLVTELQEGPERPVGNVVKSRDNHCNALCACSLWFHRKTSSCIRRGLKSLCHNLQPPG